MTDGVTSASGTMWSRRRLLLSAGVGIGAAALATGLAGCSGGKKESNIDKLVDNPSDNLNATGFPIVKQPITLHYMTGRDPRTMTDWNKVACWKKYREMSNIDIDWGLIPFNAITDKRNLALASGDYPEAFDTPSFSSLDVGKYGRQGVFAKLTTLIDRYMPNLKKVMDTYPEVKKGMTLPDGGIYGMPQIHDPNFLGDRYGQKLWVRGDWLDKFDMDVPSTTDEYYRYLKAVKDKRPNGKGDAVGYANFDITAGNALRQALNGAFGVGNRGKQIAGVAGSYIDQDPSTKHVRFYHITDEQRALLEYLHKLYSEGLILKNIFSMKRPQYTAALVKGVYGSTTSIDPAAQYAAKHFVPVPALKGPTGEHTYNNIRPTLRSIGNFVITDKNKHPIETARWMDYFYGDDGVKLFFMGVEGESYKETKDGPKYLDKITHNPQGLGEQAALKPYVTFLGGAYAGILKEAYFDGPQSSTASRAAAKLLEPDAQTDIWPAFTYTEDESQQLDSLTDDIYTYVNESRAKFITGEMPLSDWGKYVEKIKQMGLEDLLTIQQAAFERYQKA